jgi:hypothetical protein
MFIVALIVFATISTYNIFTFKNKQIKAARQYMREFKTAKAIEILNNLKTKYKDKDRDLDSLYFYALVRAKKFDLAERQLKQIDYVSNNFKDSFIEIIDILNTYYKTNLMTEFIRKCKNMNLSEDFFIKLSKSSHSFDAEMKILIQGLEYLRNYSTDKKSPPKKLMEYIFDRYIEMSKILMGRKDFVSATNRMAKLKDLKVMEDDKDKQEFYIVLGEIYEKSKNPQQAKENYELAKAAGSKKAEDLIAALEKKPLPVAAKSAETPSDNPQ